MKFAVTSILNMFGTAFLFLLAVLTLSHCGMTPKPASFSASLNSNAPDAGGGNGTGYEGPNPNQAEPIASYDCTDVGQTIRAVVPNSNAQVTFKGSAAFTVAVHSSMVANTLTFTGSQFSLSVQKAVNGIASGHLRVSNSTQSFDGDVSCVVTVKK